MKWWRKAAEQGYADAQFSLGVAYDNGQGVPQDNDEAVKWYRKAVEQGDANAESTTSESPMLMGQAFPKTWPKRSSGGVKLLSRETLMRRTVLEYLMQVEKGSPKTR